MTWRRASAALVAAVCLVAALVVVGRHERSRQIRRQAAGFRLVERLVGPLDNPQLAGFRVLPGFDCLIYRRGENAYALELCADADGRIVEAIDRRAVHRRFWTLRFEPTASHVRVDPADVQRLIGKMRLR